MRGSSPSTRVAGALACLLLHLLLAWLLFRTPEAEPRLRASPSEGLSTRISLLPAPVLSVPRVPVSAPVLRLPALELPPPELHLVVEPERVTTLAARSPTSSVPPEVSSAPGAPSKTIAAADCLPLYWLQSVSERISYALHYPAQARQLRQRGTAYVRVSVDRAGLVLDAPLLLGSGHRALDVEAQAVFQRIGRFAPVPAGACAGADIVVIDQPIRFGGGPL